MPVYLFLLYIERKTIDTFPVIPLLPMNKRNILTLVLMFAALATSANQRLLQLPADTAALADRLCQPRQWAPLPAAGDPYWQENLPEDLRQSYIRHGER